MIIKFTIGLPVLPSSIKRVFHSRGKALLNAVLIATAAVVVAPLLFAEGSEASGAEVEKLEGQVRSLNAAVEIYRHFGGVLEDAATPAEVIAELQSATDSLATSGSTRFSGSLVDRRLSTVALADSERTTLRPRVVWDRSAGQFAVTTEPVGGVAGFSFRGNAELNLANAGSKAAGGLMEDANLGLR